MTAFFIATSKIKDTQKFAEYGASVAPTLARFGGELVIKGKADKTIDGPLDHDAVGVIKFPDMEKLDGWYQSDDYQALIPLRDEAVDMTLTTYQVPE